METALQLLVSGVTLGCVYAMVGLGMNLVFAGTRVVNFALGEFVMFGALVGITLRETLLLPYSLAAVLAALATGLLGVLMAAMVVRAVELGAPISSLIIITSGVGFLIRSVAEVAWGRDPIYSSPVLGMDTFKVAGAQVFPQSLVVWGVTAVLLVAVFLVVERSRVGLEFQAVSANHRSAWLVGINVNRITVLAFFLSSALSAVVGFVYSPLTTASAFMGTVLTSKGFAAALIGGLGSSPGAIVGGLVLGISEAFAAGYVSSAYGDAVSFLILLLVLFLRPQGLLTQLRGG